MRRQRATAAQARDAARDAGAPTLDDRLGFPSAATFPARAAARDARGRLFARVDAETWAFKLQRASPKREPAPAPEPGERVRLAGAEYVVLELMSAPAARRLTGLVAMRRVLQGE